MNCIFWMSFGISVICALFWCCKSKRGGMHLLKDLSLWSNFWKRKSGSPWFSLPESQPPEMWGFSHNAFFSHSAFCSQCFFDVWRYTSTMVGNHSIVIPMMDNHRKSSLLMVAKPHSYKKSLISTVGPNHSIQWPWIKSLKLCNSSNSKNYLSRLLNPVSNFSITGRSTNFCVHVKQHLRICFLHIYMQRNFFGREIIQEQMAHMPQSDLLRDGYSGRQEGRRDKN